MTAPHPGISHDAMQAALKAYEIYSTVMENAERIHNNKIEADEAELLLTSIIGRTRFYLALHSRELEKLWKRIRENSIATDFLHLMLVHWKLHYPNIEDLTQQAASALSFEFGYENDSATACDDTFVDTNTDFALAKKLLRDNQWFLFLFYANAGLLEELVALNRERG